MVGYPVNQKTLFHDMVDLVNCVEIGSGDVGFSGMVHNKQKHIKCQTTMRMPPYQCRFLYVDISQRIMPVRKCKFNYSPSTF